MEILSFIVQLAGATMLLLYAVRMVRTGIERALGASFRRRVTTTSNPISAAATGVVMAVILQSSAAVALLTAGFTGSGSLTLATGLPIILGADIGSALLIQILSFDLEWLLPVLLAAGGAVFLKSDRRKLRQAGRVLLGIAFILIALRLLRETMIPIRESTFLPAIAGYLESDYMTAFILGGALAFLMHSSVATILMCVTFVAIDAIPVNAGMALVLGANLGSALIPVWLSRMMNPGARRVTIANFLIRGSAALLALLLFWKFHIPTWLAATHDAQTLINVHIFFNCTLLVALPFCRLIERPLSAMIPDEVQPEEALPTQRSALDISAATRPGVAIAALKREVLHMAELVGEMFDPVMQQFSDFNKARMNEIRALDNINNNMLQGIKHYVADLPYDSMSPEEQDRVRELTEYAIALKTASGIVCRRLLAQAQEKSSDGVLLSRAGLEELSTMHERINGNIALGMNLLISNDLESARLLLEEKSELLRLERSSRKKHLKRLRDGSAVSFDSSNIHLETLRALNEFNSRIASYAYPLLYSEGQLLETRLIENLGNTHSPD